MEPSSLKLEPIGLDQDVPQDSLCIGEYSMQQQGSTLGTVFLAWCRRGKFPCLGLENYHRQ